LVKDRQKDDFLDTVTHELRTPITAIRAASEILYDDDDIPEELRKQFLQNIISESDRLNRLIDKILDLERFETGRQQLFPEQVDLVALVARSLAPLQQLIDSNGISVDYQASGTLWVTADAERIIQVVTNLLSNAIKFADENGGIIRITVEKSPEGAAVTVYNNGRNIHPDDLEAIFDKFYQSGNQTTRKPVGSGLGLAIARQIVESHKGTIRAQNHEPHGVTFTFELPVNYTEI
jgi:signal transduction histidine kinase